MIVSEKKKHFDLPMPHDDKLVQLGNEIIEAGYSMSAEAGKIKSIAIVGMSKRDLTYRVNLVEIAEKLGLDTEDQATYDSILMWYKEVRDTPIRFTRDGQVTGHFIGSLEIMPDGRTVEFEFTPKIHAALYERYRRGSYSKFAIKNIYGFTNMYSQRVYELLITRRNLKPNYVDDTRDSNEKWHKRSFDLDEFRFKLNIENKYNRFGDLNDAVLKPVMAEINEHTDIEIQLEKRRQGRTIKFLDFFVRFKPEEKVEYDSTAIEVIPGTPDKDIFASLKSAGMNDIQATNGAIMLKGNKQAHIEIYHRLQQRRQIGGGGVPVHNYANYYYQSVVNWYEKAQQKSKKAAPEMKPVQPPLEEERFRKVYITFAAQDVSSKHEKMFVEQLGLARHDLDNKVYFVGHIEPERIDKVVRPTVNNMGGQIATTQADRD